MFSKLVSAKIHQKFEMSKGFSNASLANSSFFKLNLHKYNRFCIFAASNVTPGVAVGLLDGL